VVLTGDCLAEIVSGVDSRRSRPRSPVPFALAAASTGTGEPTEEGDAMSLAMSPTEREAFLADVHVGVVSVANGDRGPLTIPIWYSYEPGGLLSFITGRDSQKARRIADAGRLSVCAQTETAPYEYVTVEGPVAAVDDPVDPAERRDVAYRYLGAELGDRYLAATEAENRTGVTIRLRPEHWLSVDFTKQFG
jgi:nitroimidazol reductase NimA-like FMN-containing flavoprotein (pyridoxamine 5'-phosphate oxidase superfamily)